MEIRIAVCLSIRRWWVILWSFYWCICVHDTLCDLQGTFSDSRRAVSFCAAVGYDHSVHLIILKILTYGRRLFDNSWNMESQRAMGAIANFLSNKIHQNRLNGARVVGVFEKLWQTGILYSFYEHTKKFFRNNSSHEFLLQLLLICYFTRYTVTRVSYVDKFYQLLILYNLRIILYILCNYYWLHCIYYLCLLILNSLFIQLSNLYF